jgi:hypothetical protein
LVPLRYEELLEILLKTVPDRLLIVPFAFTNCNVNDDPFKFDEVTLLIKPSDERLG